ncbi:MAG TPA: hypothetical protein VNE38_06845 [Ktedonobacteraceae bacterium]|nr:hypothetical protein [Ktedonobacteraceae bacterium]
MSIRQTGSAFHRDEKNASLIHLFEVRLQKLKRLFVISSLDQVQRILKTYPSLLPLLFDVHQNIERYFPDSEIMLDATLDPEGLMGENEELVISICTQLDSKTAIKTLEQFYDEWWSPLSNEATDKISIGLEFV